MKSSTVECLREAAEVLLPPLGIVRAALLGHSLPHNSGEEVHLLVEFGVAARTIELKTWLDLQRRIAERCMRKVELVSVSGFEERVAAEAVAITVIYDKTASD